MFNLNPATSMWYVRAGLNDPYLLAFFLFAAFVFGSCIGSFLNVCIWRLPLGQSISNVPSHCIKCDKEIRWFDNIPIISYLVLRGSCRGCGVHISCRYIIVEALTGIIFAALFFKIGIAEQPVMVLANYWIMTMLVVTTIWIDFEHRIIPDMTTYPAIIFGLIVAFLLPEAWGTDGRFWALLMSFLGGGIIGLLLLIFRWIGGILSKKEVIGLGDVKFIVATGVLLGLSGGFFTLLLGSLLGTFYGIGKSVYMKQPLKNIAIPFGPFLAIGAVIWMFVGNIILKIFNI